MAGHTNGSANGHASPTNTFDVLVVGGGVGGINSAYRLSTELPPSTTFAVLESRHEVGGTWSLFKYPGVRSDSDLHTFGFEFHPWKSSNTIASGESILSYMQETINKFDLGKYLKFGQKVVAADWRNGEQMWRLEVDVSQAGGQTRRVVYWTKWLILGTGYYSYDKPMVATIPGLENFAGKVVHPQFWPEDLDCKDKKIVVIGSGATAITLLPALVDRGAAQVIQLQRSPSYVMSTPQEKPEDAGWFQRMLPEWMVLKWKRFINILVPVLLYNFCIYYPDRAKKIIGGGAKKLLPNDFPVDPHLRPGYNPWQQRLCFCPDGDYFKCFDSGRANIVTDTIKNVTKTGIELTGGEVLEADYIVTATGLRTQLFGGMAVTIDGQSVNIPEQYLWRFAMVTSLPNLGYIIGYWNHSWTLGADISVHMYIRMMKRMQAEGYTSVVPYMSAEDHKRKDMTASPLTSTYVQKAINAWPKCKDGGPWTQRPNWFLDRWRAQTCSLDDGLKWDKVST